MGRASLVTAPKLIKTYYKLISQKSIKTLLECPRTTSLPHPGSHTAPSPILLYHSQIPYLYSQGPHSYHPCPCPQTLILLLQTTMSVSCLTTNPLNMTIPLAPNHLTALPLASLTPLMMVMSTVVCPSAMEGSQLSSRLHKTLSCIFSSALRSSLLDCKFNLDCTRLDCKMDWTVVLVHSSLRPVQLTVQGF